MAITSDADKLRLAIGDTDSTNYVFNDDEMDVFLTESTAAAQKLAAVEAGILKMAREYDFETDGQKFWRSQMSAQLRALAKDLRAQGVVTAASSGLSTLTSTRVDGYSQDIDNEETASAGGSAVSNRQRYYQVGGLDHLP